MFVFFFSSRRRHTRFDCDWSSDVCSSDLLAPCVMQAGTEITTQALCQTCLKSVVGRAGRICCQADYSQVGIHASASRERKARISIDALQQSGSSRSYVPNLHYEILR